MTPAPPATVAGMKGALRANLRNNAAVGGSTLASIRHLRHPKAAVQHASNRRVLTAPPLRFHFSRPTVLPDESGRAAAPWSDST